MNEEDISFVAFGKSLKYKSDLGERMVELPLALQATKEWGTGNYIEVGWVTPMHKGYWPERDHRVIDLFEPDPGAEHSDACGVDYSGKNVLCVSTLEHFDLPDYGNTVVGGSKGKECLQKIMREGNQWFITLPIGYNLVFDAWLHKSGIRLYPFRQYEPRRWVQVHDGSVRWDSRFSHPYDYSNEIVVISNQPWVTTYASVHCCVQE